MKKKKAPRVRLRKIATIKLEIWKLLSKRIRERDKNICYTCGKTATMAGHFIHNSDKRKTKDGNMLWCYELNLHAQCFSCNMKQHGRLDVYAERLVREYGADILENLRRLYLLKKSYSREELGAKLEEEHRLARFGE